MLGIFLIGPYCNSIHCNILLADFLTDYSTYLVRYILSNKALYHFYQLLYE